jgi:hypothetical protein
MEIGIAYRKSMLHRRQNTFYGGYVEVVCQLVLVFKIGACRVHCLVLFVIIIMKMIGMWCLVVRLAFKAGKPWDCNNFFSRGCNLVEICVKLFWIYVLQMINMQLVSLLLLFGCYGVTEIIAFGMIQKNRE